MVTAADLRAAYEGRGALITGGLGFLGSNLAHRLAALGARVTLVDTMTEESGGNLANIAGLEDRVRVNFSDIRDENSLRYLVKGQDFLFNLAAQSSHLYSIQDPMYDLEINAKAQLMILEVCRHVNAGVKIVFAGTRQVYGHPRYVPVDEAHPIDPVDVNGINKVAGEWFHLLYARLYKMRIVSLRLTNTYGPRQAMKDNRHGFLPWFIRLAMEGRDLPLYGDGRQTRDFNYVDDVVEAFLLAGASAAVEGAVFNLAGEKPWTLLDVAERLIRLTRKGRVTITPFPLERAAIEIGNYYGTSARLEQATGWKPAVPLEEGLRRTIAFYDTHRAQYW